jgi:hypothetical protein
MEHPRPKPFVFSAAAIASVVLSTLKNLPKHHNCSDGALLQGLPFHDATTHLSGHSSISNTQIYTHVSMENLLVGIFDALSTARSHHSEAQPAMVA